MLASIAPHHQIRYAALAEHILLLEELARAAVAFDRELAKLLGPVRTELGEDVTLVVRTMHADGFCRLDLAATDLDVESHLMRTEAIRDRLEKTLFDALGERPQIREELLYELAEQRGRELAFRFLAATNPLADLPVPLPTVAVTLSSLLHGGTAIGFGTVIRRLTETELDLDILESPLKRLKGCSHSARELALRVDEHLVRGIVSTLRPNSKYERTTESFSGTHFCRDRIF